ncbi:MAG: hypothetical protein AB7H97_22665 [Pseudobdellovibrionaceae bacterium]
MRYLLLLWLISLSACALAPRSSKVMTLSYERVFEFKIGESLESDIVEVLGVPENRFENKGYYVLNFSDPRTGYQRISLNFTSADKKLNSILWIPFKGEKESSLEELKELTENRVLEEEQEDNYNPHFIMPKVVLLRDKKNGLVIRYNKDQDLVEAIAKYDVLNRLPANTEKKTRIPYTLGEVSNASKD